MIQGNSHPSIEQYRNHVNPAFIKLLGVFGYGRVYTKAQGVWIWDHQGNKYLDFLAGFGSVNLGHNHPRLLQGAKNFLESQALNLCHTGPNLYEAALAEKLAGMAAPPLKICLFASSGAEGVEAGMKLARAYTHRSRFLYCQGGFHGTNLGVLSIMGAARMRKPFEPLLEGCEAVSFGDLEVLEKGLSKKDIAAFVLEPIQGEAGVVIPPEGYLKEAQRLCDRYGTLLVLDEVQTGLGRTGSLFAYEQEDFVPSILVLAKGLSGSLAPISATLTTKKIFQKAYGSMDRFDLHSSTYGGNSFSCAIASETLDIIREENLTENSKEMGNLLVEGLKRNLEGHPFIQNIRGRGLMVAIELGPTDRGWMNKIAPSIVEGISKNVFGQWASLRLLERGMICQPAAHQWNVLKLEPPLTIQKEQIEEGIKIISGVFEEYPSLTPLLTDVSLRIGKQLFKGWEFP